ncbi:MAG: FHIPEP family type III secretion protein, partial [Hyphomicrobiales bacterium]|nr:FHIPEP family type III secretion protein [Hyphomicrobiales bacterium]
DAAIASVEIPVGDSLVIFGDGPKPDLIGEPTREPAFGMNAMWISPAFVAEAKRAGYDPVDNISVILTHLSEALRNNLAQLFSYRDMRALLDTLDPEYRKLLEEICPAQISYSGLLSIFKALLAERISIRSLNLILEAIAEAVPHLRRVEQIVEHVRIRIAPQICNEVVVDGVLNIVRAGARWDQTFHRHLKRDAKGEIVEFDIDPPLIEQFQSEAKAALSSFLDRGEAFVLVTTPENRPYLRMITERLFPNISVLSTLEIARGVNIKTLGSIS